MCDPVTLMIAAATAVSAGTTIYGGIQQKKQQEYAAKVSQNNAVMADRAAAERKEQGQREIAENARRYSAVESEQRARSAAMGLDVGFGTPLDLQTDTRTLGLADAQRIADGTAREAEGYRIQATGLRDQSAMQRYNGKQAMIGAGLEATGTILSGATQAYGSFTKAKAPKTALA